MSQAEISDAITQAPAPAMPTTTPSDTRSGSTPTAPSRSTMTTPLRGLISLTKTMIGHSQVYMPMPTLRRPNCCAFSCSKGESERRVLPGWQGRLALGHSGKVGS